MYSCWARDSNNTGFQTEAYEAISYTGVIEPEVEKQMTILLEQNIVR